MRITGGLYRGRRILCPPGVIRPAMDRMRESMFAILGDLAGLSFLDLFSGSGVVGIEAASRGADPVWLVERDRRKRRTIQRNMEFVETDVELRMMPVEAFLRKPPREFDLIYLDPPFAFRGKTELLQSVCKSRTLAPDGRLLIHAPSEDPMPDGVADLELYDRRTYGRSILSFYRLSEESGATSLS